MATPWATWTGALPQRDDNEATARTIQFDANDGDNYHSASKKLHSLLSSIRRIIQTRGHFCADPRLSCRLGHANSVGSLLHADAHPGG
jgi:hypothetical protein